MDFFLQTKLAAPVIRERLVPRSRLFQRLEEGLLQEGEFRRKLTLVAAPAGYGKTTLVAAWLQKAGRPFAWLSLEETDNDPSRFLAYLVAAASPLGADSAARQALRSPQPPPPEAVVSILLNEMAASRQALTLVLDDYHAIHTPQIHQIVAFFLDHQPARVHLVVITREDPLLPIPRLRARGQMLEIRQEDLRFTAEETDQFLCEVMKLDLADEDVSALEQRTEGWIAGLQLAALAMQGLSQPGQTGFKDFIQAFEGSSRFVIDYLIAEVFEQQPEDVREFLLKTSILDRMTGPLCDALIGQAGSQALLEHLEQANLFLIPLDAKGEWYRYHHLFAEFLRHRLRILRIGEHSAVELAGLHGRASRWYEAHGSLAEAIQHALAGEDWPRAGRLIDTAKDGMLRSGEIVTLLGWYRQLPDALVRARAELALGYAWPLVLSGQPDLAEALLSAVEPAIVDGSVQQGDYYALRAYLARARGDHAAVIAASERALALLEKSNPAARGTLGVNLGIAYWHSGLLDATEKTMAEVEHFATQTHNAYAALTARFFRARSLACRGLLRQAESLYLQILQAGGQTPLAALPHFDLAELYLEWNRLEEAEQHIHVGMELSAQAGSAEFLSSGHILRALLCLCRGEAQAALPEAELAYTLSRGFPPGARARSEALFVHIYLAQGNLAQAADWAEQMPAAVDVHPLYRFLDLTHPRLLIAQGQKEKARLLLAAGCQAARQNGWGYGLVAALVLLSLAARTEDEAVDTLAQALKLAQPEGFLRTFVDAGAGLVPILQAAARRGVCPAEVERILAESGATRPRLQGWVEPLSERELEVLRLVAAGYSNREIARELVVSLGTAKTHVHHICGKLGVRNRTEAAMRARELGLVL